MSSKLKGYRVMAGATQADMSRILGYSSQQAYGQKEIGRNSFKLEEMKVIRDYLNSKLNKALTMDDIFA
ncbi:helix-turn-helix transcriptional regulator [uncultured Veillonella sp.]|uniref:helix-turn-helix transcriptional regulator n=1 Tax=uncultured Veillonella sp. TaxID=159268 RepID=UPI002595AE5A|nr:hypothetical protein [uncultured Veillonella sp.]